MTTREKQNPEEVDHWNAVTAINNMFRMLDEAMHLPSPEDIIPVDRLDDPPGLDDPSSQLGIPKEGR